MVAPTPTPTRDIAAVRADAVEEARSWLAERGAPGVAVREIDGACPLGLWLAWPGAGPPLADVVPVLVNLGLRVDDQRSLELSDLATDGGLGGARSNGASAAGTLAVDGAAVSVDEYRVLGTPEVAERAVSQIGSLRETLWAIWSGHADSDPLDRLLLTGPLQAREVGLLRALLRYVLHAGLPLSEAYGQRVLTLRPSYARDLVELFHARLHPERADADVAAGLVAALDRELRTVGSVDEDVLLTRLRDVTLAIVRTTYHIPGTALAVKLDSRALRWLPRPVPVAEVFVSTPRFDALHLRAGVLARGGIRWSDRAEDLRTEILGLMKAQRVKNALIVPDGAKGGFVLRRAPADPTLLAAEARACYADFVRAMLTLTDNRTEAGITRWPGLVCRDGEDSYLVVAADKGTADFSDLANTIAVETGYWLGDAFASGGRTGYDHKALGITARGAWESVRRHFAELGLDADREPITVAGIGDMSGDVFGNGMLRSPHLRLVAAFDHRHVFLDPDPNPARSYEQRRRLAAMPASSWADYDPAALSAGGGIFPMSAKRVALTPEVRAVLGVEDESLDMDGLIRAILCAPVDLLWNGGIGTWVKASDEDHTDVADKARDRRRVDASQLRATVVVEGGNLGLTEAARVEYCLAGGRCNSDFVDNSAGVDCSDREVNLKIGIDVAVRDGAVGHARRNELLAEATGDVVRQVLADSARQVLALSVSERQAALSVEGMVRLIGYLVESGDLDPAVDQVPDEEVIRSRMGRGPVLTRPEIALLHAYGKRMVFEELVGSDLLDEPSITPTLDAYLPAVLRDVVGARLDRHPLWREIAASQLTDDLVDRVGAGFLFRLAELTGATPMDGVRAFVITRDLFGLSWVWDAVDAYGRADDAAAPGRVVRPGVVDPVVETMLRCRMLQENAAQWLLRRRPKPLRLTEEITRYLDGVSDVAMALPDTLRRLGATDELDTIETLHQRLLAAGLPARTAEQVARLEGMVNALDIVDVALRHDIAVTDVLAAYVDLSVRLGLGRLTSRIVDRPGDSYWELIAKGSLRSKLATSHARLVEKLLAGAKGDVPAALARLAASGGAARVRAVVDEADHSTQVNSAMATAVVLRLDDLAESSDPL
jgi:glutamate dehydrogenase